MVYDISDSSLFVRDPNPEKVMGLCMNITGQIIDHDIAESGREIHAEQCSLFCKIAKRKATDQ